MYRILFENGHTYIVEEGHVIFVTGAENLAEIATRNPGTDIVNKDKIVLMCATEDDGE